MGMPSLMRGSARCQLVSGERSPSWACSPSLSVIHAECPPRLIPETSHCETTRSSFGKRYEGKKSIKNDTSRAVPAARAASTRQRWPARPELRPALTLYRVHVDPTNPALRQRSTHLADPNHPRVPVVPLAHDVVPPLVRRPIHQPRPVVPMVLHPRPAHP